MGVLESSGYADFVEEALWAECSRQFRTEHLERDSAVMAKVVREVDRRHATAAELMLDAVTVSEGSP